MLRELKTFIAVTRHGTFAAAGMHIGLTQSAATGRLIADLAAGRTSSIPLDPFRPDRF